MPKGENSGGEKHINAGTFTPGDERARLAGQQANPATKAESGRAGGLKRAMVQTEATAAASRINGQAGGRKPKSAADTACTCGVGKSPIFGSGGIVAAMSRHAPSCRKRKAYDREQAEKAT